MKRKIERRRMRRRRLRKSVLIGSLSLGSLGGLAATADGSPNFGGWVYNNAFVFGGRWTIQTPASASQETVASNEIVVHRGVSEGTSLSGQVGLIQTGIYRTGASIRLDNCPQSIDQYTRYIEYLPADGQGQFKCQPYGPSGFGHNTNFKIIGIGDGSWMAAGTDTTEFYNYAPPAAELDFIAGDAALSTELNNANGISSVADGSTTNTLFAPQPADCDEWCVYLTPAMSTQPHVVLNSEVHQFPHTYPGSTGSAGTWSIPPGVDGVMDKMNFKHVP